MSEDKRECVMRIFEALSGVDEELLERSEAPGRKKKNTAFSAWRCGKIMAAALCFVVLGAAMWGAGNLFLVPKGAAPQNTAGNQSAAEVFMKEAAEEETMLTAEDRAAAIKEGGSEAALTETDSVPAEGALVEGALTDGGTVTDKPENFSEAEKQIEVQNNNAGNIINLTEAEACAMEVVGAYVPKTIPDGYVLETARGGSLGEQHTLFLSWTKDMEYITLSICTEEEEALVLADISKPETYDVHFYEIPYADTVPEEYRAVFENPVFISNDLSPELIESRMKVLEEAGENAIPKGNFAVYYEENEVLVQFRGCGEAKCIWDLFQSIQP